MVERQNAVGPLQKSKFDRTKTISSIALALYFEDLADKLFYDEVKLM